jgi:hypothetical protein
MSNHGKESTNEEGVNIDETQTKIDMGKLITVTPGTCLSADRLWFCKKISTSAHPLVCAKTYTMTLVAAVRYTVPRCGTILLQGELETLYQMLQP